MSTITLSGNYGFNPYIVKGLASGTIIDAAAATWYPGQRRHDGTVNDYPFRVYEAPNVVIAGGTISGKIDQSGDWRAIYDMGNSAGLRTEGTPNVVIRDWRITDTWDHPGLLELAELPDRGRLDHQCPRRRGRERPAPERHHPRQPVRRGLRRPEHRPGFVEPGRRAQRDRQDGRRAHAAEVLRLRRGIYPRLVHQDRLDHERRVAPTSSSPTASSPSRMSSTEATAACSTPGRTPRSPRQRLPEPVRHGAPERLSEAALRLDDPAGKAARDYWDKAKAAWIADHADGGGDTTTTPPPLPDPDPSPTPCRTPTRSDAH